MRASERISNVDTYYFATKLKEVAMLREQGQEIINLGIGSPDIEADDVVIDALQSASRHEGAGQYQSYNGIPELRQAFADWYHRQYDVMLDPLSEILPLMGSKEAIMHIHLAFCNPGDTVLIPDPGYPTYTSSAKMLGVHVLPYELKEENNWIPSIDELESMDLSNCKVMWINYPHMPTGAVASEGDLLMMIEFAKKHDILLVNDNPYSLILNRQPLSIHAFAGEYSDVIELNSLSKSHNMSGWRVGVVTGSAENITHLLKVKSNFDSGMFKPIQLAAVAALNLGKQWSDRLDEEYGARQRLIHEIADRLNCTYDRSGSGLFVWAKVSPDFENGEALSDHLLYEHKVFVTPGSVFGSNSDQYIRFSLCANQEEIRKALSNINTL